MPRDFREEFGQVVLVVERRWIHPIFALSEIGGQCRLAPILHFQPFIRFVFLFASTCLREAIPLMRNIRHPKHILILIIVYIPYEFGT